MRAHPSTSLAAVILAACGTSASSTTSGSSTTGVASVTATAVVETPPSAAPPSAVPAVSAPPTADAAAAPSAAAPTVTAAAAVDAGAAKVRKSVVDAGSEASVDAGASAPVSPGLAVAREVDAIFVKRKTFSARFKQQHTQKVTGTVKESTGVVFVERPDKISFHYDPPNKNRIVSDGTTIKVYIAEDNQMFETPVDKTQYPGALAFMMGSGIASSFTFTINTKSAYSGTVLEGKPLAPNPSYETVMFFVGKDLLAKGDPGAIERVLILDAQGNRNRFDFHDAVQPAMIAPAEFTFTPPPGTNITR